MIRKFILAGVALAGLTALAGAQNLDAIKARQDLLKEMGKATKPIGAMLKKEMPFDLAVVQTALKTHSANAKKLAALFPADSKTGNDTEALPKIWEDKANFEAGFAKLDKDATAALAAITSEDTFRANMGGVLRNCQSCHETYRLKK